MRSLKRVTPVLAVALAALALTAPAAMAEVQWSAPQVKWSGTLTFKRDGENARTCAFNHVSDVSGAHYQPSKSSTPIPWEWFVPCGQPAATMRWGPTGYAESDGEGGYQLSIWDEAPSCYMSSPWGMSPAWCPEIIEGDGAVTFTNASGGTPSHITFEEDVVGFTNYDLEPVTASGTINMLTTDGKSSVTLSGE